MDQRPFQCLSTYECLEGNGINDGQMTLKIRVDVDHSGSLDFPEFLRYHSNQNCQFDFVPYVLIVAAV